MRLNALLGSSLSLLLATGFTVSAQAPPRADNSAYEAVRRNDLPALRNIVKTRGPDAQDASGLTPLVLATAFGTPESVRVLLDLGANVNATAIGGLTALHVAWHDLAVARLLIDKGAKVDARTLGEATPLWVAASANGTLDVVTILLARGADPNAADNRGVTPLIAAASVGNTAVAMLLLRKGAAPDAYAPAIGQKTVTPLMGAAMNGDLTLARALLQAKPDLNRQSPDNDGAVKNGRVAMGQMTALHLAVASHNAAMVKMLVDAGAFTNAPDVRGFTPLVWAVGSDRSNPVLTRTLLDAGADRLATAKGGETAIDWARRYNNPEMLLLLNVTPVTTTPLKTGQPRPAMDGRATVERALPLLRNASARMMTDGGCVACHAQPLTAMASGLAATRGWGGGSDQNSLSQMQQQLTGGLSGYLHGRESGGLPDNGVFTMMAMSIASLPPSPGTDAFVNYLAAKQRDAGNWHGLTGRPPMQDGDITRTALGIKALVAYGSPARRQEWTTRLAKATRWLDAQQPLTTEERVMQILGLTWAGADSRRLRDRQQELLKLQRADGGWGQTPDLVSDAYATGQALYTLSVLRVPPADAAIRRGTDFLIRSQAEDGSWHVTSRALKIQPYFESGFPYGHDQWISQAGSAWAVIGLASTARNDTVTRR